MKTDNHTKLAAVAAVLVGLFAVVAVNKYITRQTAVPPAPKASILVATMEIGEGSEIGEEMLGSAEIPFDDPDCRRQTAVSRSLRGSAATAH